MKGDILKMFQEVKSCTDWIQRKDWKYYHYIGVDSGDSSETRHTDWQQSKRASKDIQVVLCRFHCRANKSKSFKSKLII